MAKEYEYIKAPVQNLDEMEIPEDALNIFASYVAKAVTKYFKVEENRKKFEEWYFETHGEKYVWKTMKVSDLKADSN